MTAESLEIVKQIHDLMHKKNYSGVHALVHGLLQESGETVAEIQQNKGYGWFSERFRYTCARSGISGAFLLAVPDKVTGPDGKVTTQVQLATGGDKNVKAYLDNILSYHKIWTDEKKKPLWLKFKAWVRRTIIKRQHKSITHETESSEKTQNEAVNGGQRPNANPI